MKPKDGNSRRVKNPYNGTLSVKYVMNKNSKAEEVLNSKAEELSPKLKSPGAKDQPSLLEISEGPNSLKPY